MSTTGLDSLLHPKAGRRLTHSTLHRIPSLDEMHAGDFSIEVGRNICHGSDSVDSANREIGLWCVRCVRSIAGGVVCVGGVWGSGASLFSLD